MGRRYFQAHSTIHRGLSEQASRRQVCFEALSSERVQRWRHLSRHSTEQLEPNLRHLGRSHIHPEPLVRSQP